MLVFLPAGSDAIVSELTSVPSLSTGLLSATQGNYLTAQLLLDITQGARVSYSAYAPAWPPAMSLAADQISDWHQAVRRASGAPQILQPGLLASSIPGGAAYAGTVEDGPLDSLVAADRSGHVAAASLGPAATLPARIARLSRRYALVVADLPTGSAGTAQLRLLAARRPANQLLLVLQRAPDERGYELLWASLAGLGGGRTLTSSTTNERGLIAAIDIAPTILRHLARPIPAAMRGEPIRLDGSFDGAYLRALKARLAVVYPRRLPALAWLLVAWAVLMLAALLPLPRMEPSPGRRTTALLPFLRTEPAGRRAGAMRIGALALLWTPAAELLPAALEPSRTVEYALLVLTCFLLGFLSDRLLCWPRALLAPALSAVLALSADALLHTQLLIRSLLGPNPIYGARFYGIGNELKSALAVLVFAAVAAWLYPAERGRRAAATMAAAGIVLAIVEGSARIGAGVGGVILVSAGTAVATVMLLPGRLTRRRALLILIAPVAGLVALAALDLATAHGSGHFTGSILHARSAGDLRDVIERRYGAAYEELKHGAMPVATGLGLIAMAFGLRRRERLLEPVGGDPAWLAALSGGLAAGVVGALSEDSGPVLFVVAVFVLICVLGYLWGRPPGRSREAMPRTAGTSRAERSRARRRPRGALAR